jgi:hypothetical protein
MNRCLAVFAIVVLLAVSAVAEHERKLDVAGTESDYPQ